MGEIEEGVNEMPQAAEAEGPPVPVPGGSLFSFEEEPGPEVLEGLAEADIPPGDSAVVVNTLNDSAASVPHAALASVQNALSAMGETLGKRLDTLQAVFDRELRAEGTRERVIDRLHAELQEYKQDLLLKVQRPIFIDLIQLHDDIGKMIASRESAPGQAEDASGFRIALESIQTAIEDILYRQGVEPFSVEANEFDPRRQRAISTQTTEDPALNKAVATRLRKGFQAGEKLIRPEMVTVFTFRPGPPATME
jgi:molecular chaperone GrpE